MANARQFVAGGCLGGIGHSHVPQVLELFSRPTQPRSITPLSTKHLNAVIKRVTSRWKADVTVSLVDGFLDLPAPLQKAARDQGSNGGDIRDVFHNGSIYLVHGNIASIQPGRQNQ